MRTEILDKLMATILPGAGYVLVIGRGDGKTLILGTENAGPRLAMVNGASPLEHQVRAVRTDHFKLIAACLRERFRAFADDCFGLWVAADFTEVAEALEDYDPATGERIRDGALYVGDRGYVRAVGKGTVTGFRGGRVLLRFGDAVFPVPRSMVKSVVKVPGALA